MSELIYKEESYKIIGCCFEVYNNLGPGFLESVYQEALSIEFVNNNIPFEEQKELTVFYKGKVLRKKFFADFVCYDQIIIEIKAMAGLAPDHEAQLLNYLKATKKPLGLLVNFGAETLQRKRFANTNS